MCRLELSTSLISALGDNGITVKEYSCAFQQQVFNAESRTDGALRPHELCVVRHAQVGREVWGQTDFVPCALARTLYGLSLRCFAEVQGRLVEPPFLDTPVGPDYCSVLGSHSAPAPALGVQPRGFKLGCKSGYLLAGLPPENGSQPLLEGTSPY